MSWPGSAAVESGRRALEFEFFDLYIVLKHEYCMSIRLLYYTEHDLHDHLAIVTFKLLMTARNEFNHFNLRLNLPIKPSVARNLSTPSPCTELLS
jgi:hypothetical protein